MPRIKKTKLAHIISFAFIVIMLGFALQTHGQTAPYKPLAPIEFGNTSIRYNNVTYFIIDMFRIAVAVSAVLAVLMIIFGGFQYMSTDSWSGNQEGKKRIQQALLGLFFVIISYLVLQTINPNFVNLAPLGNFTKTSEFQTRVTNVVSHSGETSVAELNEYYVTDGNKTYKVVAHRYDNTQNIDLNNLYTYKETQSTFPVNYKTMAECETYTKTRQSSDIAEQCKQVPNWIDTYGASFASASECSTKSLKPATCAQQDWFRVTIYVNPQTFTNYTQKACETMVANSRAANSTNSASCVKQDKPL